MRKMRKIYLKILSITLLLKFNLSTKFVLQVERTFLERHVHQKLAYLTHLIAMPEFKIYPSNHLRRHKNYKNNRTKFTYVCVNLIFPASLASGKRDIELKKVNRSINSWKVSLVLKLCFSPKNYITK